MRIISNEKIAEQFGYFARGETLFDVENGDFIVAVMIRPEGKARVCRTKQDGKIINEALDVVFIQENIKVCRWVIEDGEFDPRGFGQKVDAYFALAHTAYQAGRTAAMEEMACKMKGT
jgi:hypothetical protein